MKLRYVSAADTEKSVSGHDATHSAVQYSFYELPNMVIECVPSPVVSVCTMTYNHANYIEKCIEGVLMQKADFKFEFIIGEDFSSDGTREMVFSYAQKNPELIRVITADQNVGRMPNALRTRDAARGEFIAICEGDDYWTDPLKLQKQVNALTTYSECDLCFHPVVMKRFEKPDFEPIKNRYADQTKIFPVEKLIIEHGGFCPSVSMMIRGNYRQHLGPWRRMAPAGDYFLQVLGAMRGGALYLNEVMAVYNKGIPGSWSETVQNRFKKTEHELKMCMAILEFDKKLERKYHKYFIKRIHNTLGRVFRNVFAEDKETISEIYKLVRTHSSGMIRIYSHWYLLLSFGYYRLKVGRLKKRLRSVLG